MICDLQAIKFNISYFDQKNQKTRLRLERGIPVGLWDDGAVLAIVMVEEVCRTTPQIEMDVNCNSHNF